MLRYFFLKPLENMTETKTTPCFVCQSSTKIEIVCYNCVRRSKIFDDNEVYMNFLGAHGNYLALDNRKPCECRQVSFVYYKMPLCTTCLQRN